jgi:hypothetical protein
VFGVANIRTIPLRRLIDRADEGICEPTSPLRFFASRGPHSIRHADRMSLAPPDRGRSSPLLHVRCLRPMERAFAAWPGLAAMAVLMGFLPFAVLLLAWSVGTFPSLAAHLPFPKAPTSMVFVEGSPVLSQTLISESTTVDRGRSARLLGFILWANPCPPGTALSKSGPKLPWAFCPLSGVGRDQPPETASSSYPLMGFGRLPGQMGGQSSCRSHSASPPPFSVLRGWRLAVSQQYRSPRRPPV